MVEAGGVENSSVFAVTRNHAYSFVFLRTLLSDIRTRTRQREDILPRLAPSDRGGGGVARRRGGDLPNGCIGSKKFLQRGAISFLIERLNDRENKFPAG
jgi:hypothetical protein